MMTVRGIPRALNALSECAFGVEQYRQSGDAVLLIPCLDGIRAATIRGQWQHRYVLWRECLRQHLERGHLGDAGRAPGSPQVDHHGAALELAQSVGGAVRGQEHAVGRGDGR